MSRDNFLRYMAQYGNIYDSPSYQGFQIFLSEQNQQIPDKHDGTQHPDTISESKMDKELSESSSSHSNSLSQYINNALVQHGHGLEVGSVPDRVPELLEKIKEFQCIIKEKDIQIEQFTELTERLMQMSKQDSEMRKQLICLNKLMMKEFQDRFPPPG